MEISSASQSAGQVTVGTQPNTPQAGEIKTVADQSLVMQKDFEVNLDEGLKAKLADLTLLLQSREQLIKSLPENIQKAVVELLQQVSSESELSQGLSSLLTGQKNIVEQLKNLSNVLEFAAVLNKAENRDIKVFLQKVLQNIAGQLDVTPEQLAKQLLQLAKQLSATTTMPQSNYKQAVEAYLQGKLPENVQQLSGNDQKNLNQLTKLLGKDMPLPLQQLAQKNALSQLPGIWSILKVVDASQFKDIQPKTLQAAADLLRQFSQEMSSVKTEIAGQLEQFVKTLPSEVSHKAAIVTQLEQFIKKLPTEGGSKSAVILQLEEFVKDLPREVGSKAAVLTQLEQFVKKMPGEMGNKAADQIQLEKMFKTLPLEISKVLQQVLKQGNLPTNLLSLADTLSDAASLNEHMTNEQKTFSMNLVEKIAAKSSSIPGEINNGLAQLATKFSDTATLLDQMKILVNQLKTQLLSTNPNLVEKEHNFLDQLTKLFGQNIPQALKEGAARHKLGELPKVWILLKGLGIEPFQNMEYENLQKSAALVKELAQSIYKSTGAAGEKQIEHSLLSFSVPLQVAPGIHYPAHIHIYHQQKDENSSQANDRQFETWLRVCVDTENLGMVDSVFRLYGENQLDVRVTFPSEVAAEEFSQDLHNIRKKLEDSTLNLTEIMVNNV